MTDNPERAAGLYTIRLRLSDADWLRALLALQLAIDAAPADAVLPGEIDVARTLTHLRALLTDAWAKQVVQ